VKTCFKCGRTLPVEEFYRHAGMADGCLGKCKGCTRLDVRIWYRRTKAARIKYEVARAQTAKRKVAVLEYQRRRRKRRPEVERAHRLVKRALELGRLVKSPCEVCNSPDVQAHHPDYTRPLYVRWLCLPHHRIMEGRA